MKKRIILFTLFLLACVSLCAGTAEAKVHTGKWGGNVTWTYNTVTKTLIITGSGEIANVPGCVHQPGWFNFYDDVETVKIQGNITRIGSEILEMFSSLKKVEMPNTVRSIGKHAFCYCVRLKEISFSSELEVLEAAAFDCCEELRYIQLPKSLKVIKKNCFADVGAKTITVPENVEEIQKKAFSSLSGFTGKQTRIIIKSKKIKKWGDDIFEYANNKLVIEVPKSKYKEYKKALKKGHLPSYVKVVGKKSLD